MKRLAASSILLFSVACSGSSPTSASKTTTVATTSAPGPPAPGPSLETKWTVSGTAWVFDGVTKHPADSGDVLAWVESTDGTALFSGGPVGSNGRFAIDVRSRTRRVWFNPNELGYKPCLSTFQPTGNTSVDAYFVTATTLLGANLPQELIDLGPTLSGQVYENTPSGRQPVPNHAVFLDGLWGSGDLLVATTRTDADGRYVFCNMQNLPQLVLGAGGGSFNDFGSTSGVGKYSTFDVELKRKGNGRVK